MSKAVDAERAAAAEDARRERNIVFLKELLRIVELQREGLTVTVIAARIGRDRWTVYSRQRTLEELLERIGQKGKRRRE